MGNIKSECVYPKPEKLPKPDLSDGCPYVTLSELKPSTYTNMIAKVSSSRVSERRDQLGTKTVFTGILEDKTFRVPFVCHKTSIPMERDVVLNIRSAYVHEFQDRSLLLILTEYSKAKLQQIEDLRNYIWRPKIAHFKRPVWNVILKGIVSTIYKSSGLVKRCNKCKTLVFDTCPNNCKEGWSWDFRISSRIYDSSGSIKMILPRHLATRILGRSICEILFLANVPNNRSIEGFDSINYYLSLPEKIQVMEAVVENASSLRSKDKLIVTDGLTLAYFPSNSGFSMDVGDASLKQLDPKDPHDSKIIRKIIGKTLDISIRRITGKPLLHGLYLLEEPIPLYRCEKARLYLGFSLKTGLEDEKIVVEVSPQAFVRESTWDYVKWRRSRGATAKAIVNTLQRYRSNVILAPFGYLGHIEDVIFKKAGEQRVSEVDKRNFVDFWKDIYGIEVSPEEIPLLKVKLIDSEHLFTYPPSTAYFDKNQLFISANTQRFVEFKKSSLKERVRSVLLKALQDVSIENQELSFLGEKDKIDTQRLLFYDIQRKLFGREVRAQGRITQFRDQFYFFPRRVLQVS
ncbi:MAG: hypothetical protein L6N95_04815 [Candidatus Methylarchaceae archaeon HK01B]|nr:hypothetical protein [Candidatus Methylarchaceae archaeon HK01B]